MTKDKAIKLIQKDIDDEDVDWDSPLGSAYKLSFEALKRCKVLAENSPLWAAKPLPGETKD